ncbi:ubiquitin-associated protein 2-like [Protobothrops mucrosquamatus]|uniref:ubiquitin-associated protein 2-like n=1 Tax=Protobothrops mucrosquamatus TaxID=103944 RepID=UPI000775F1B7|nr:ubiquitin-associated protein 2-like [Protobothrops mucrosquamatus]
MTYQSSVPPSEPVSVAVMNGHNGVRMQPALDTTSTVPTSKLETSPPSLPAKGPSLPSTTASTSLLLPSAPSHTAALPSSDLANSSLSQLSSSLSDHPSSLSSASSHTHNSVENATALQPSNSFSVPATMSTTSSATGMASTTNSLGLNATSVSLPIPTSRAAPLVSSGSQS